MIDGLELVHDGVVVGASSARGAAHLSLGERVTIERSGWLAVRVRSGATIRSGFSTNMGAHSSPIYLDVDGQRPYDAGDAAAIGTIIDGARTWIEAVAPVRSSAERARLAGFLAESRTTLDALIRDRSGS